MLDPQLAIQKRLAFYLINIFTLTRSATAIDDSRERNTTGANQMYKYMYCKIQRSFVLHCLSERVIAGPQLHITCKCKKRSQVASAQESEAETRARAVHKRGIVAVNATATQAARRRMTAQGTTSAAGLDRSAAQDLISDTE